jgi:hypothetical protein
MTQEIEDIEEVNEMTVSEYIENIKQDIEYFKHYKYILRAYLIHNYDKAGGNDKIPTYKADRILTEIGIIDIHIYKLEHYLGQA